MSNENSTVENTGADAGATIVKKVRKARAKFRSKAPAPHIIGGRGRNANSRAAKINNVLLTAKAPLRCAEIEALCDKYYGANEVLEVRNHLAALLKDKAVEHVDGAWRMKKERKKKDKRANKESGRAESAAAAAADNIDMTSADDE
jgi:hypothetical protein